MANVAEAHRLGIEFVVEIAGATPTVTFIVEGSLDGGTTWHTLAYVRPDSTVAVSIAGIVRTAVGKEVVYVDGLDKRFFTHVAVNVTANTNITYRANLHRADLK